MKKKLLLMLNLLVLLLCGSALADNKFYFAEKEPVVFEGETLVLEMVRQGDCADPGELTFTSGRTTYATVDNDGTVLGIKPGKVSIKATLKGEKRTWTASVTVTVARRVAAISVNESRLTVLSPRDPSIAHLVNASDNTPVLVLSRGNEVSLSISLQPEDATNRRYTVQSGDTNILRASGSTLTARKAGVTTLTIQSQQNPEITKVYRVLVTEPVTKVAVSLAEKTLFVGEGTYASVQITPDNASVQDVTWSSSNEDVATVDEFGVVRAHKKGTADIKATAKDGSGRWGRATLTVKQPPEYITLSRTEASIKKGGSLTLKATVKPDSTSDKSVTWTTSDPSVATVSSSGSVTAKGPGVCVITCASKGFPSVYAEAVITVYQPVTKVEFEEQKPYVAVGDSIRLHWIVSPNNATDTSVTLSTNKPSLVSISQDGTITGLKHGECYIYAQANDGSGKKATVKLRITQPVTGVHMKYSEMNVGLNKYTTNTAILEPEGADVGEMIWTSLDERIAVVTGDKLRPKVTGKSWGSTTIIGVTKDGGYVVTYTVNVGSKKDALRITNLYSEYNDTIRIQVYNPSNLVITQFRYEIELYDAFGVPLPCNANDGSNKFTGAYYYTLYPEDSTRSGRFTFGREFSRPMGIGKVVMRITSFVTEDGETFRIPEGDRPEYTWEATVREAENG